VDCCEKPNLNSVYMIRIAGLVAQCFLLLTDSWGSVFMKGSYML